MINRELIEVFSEIAREKNVDRSELGSIIEQLFLYIIEKQTGDSSNCSVIVNIDKGEIEIYAEKTIVDKITDPHTEITLKDVLKQDPDLSDLQIGDPFVEVIDPRIFSRRIIAHAKQFFSQRIVDVERKYIYEDYANRVGEIVIGIVHQVQRDNIFINIDHAELRMPRKEQIPSERFRRGDTTRAVIKSVEITAKGPDIVISRADNHFLYKLFEMEVPEIEDGIIEITKIARHPGERAKIIVHSHDRRIDAVGACVGMRGSRIQAIVRELNNEKIDIVNHSDKPEILITRALSPAKPLELHIDDERNYCVALFEKEELETAIGKGGVNINLASNLIDYKIDAFTPDEYKLYLQNSEIALKSLKDLPKYIVNSLADININNVAELLSSSEERILKADEIAEDDLIIINKAIKPFAQSNDKEETEEETKKDAEDNNKE